MPMPMPMPSSGARLLQSPQYLFTSVADAGRLNLPALQSKMKCDPEGYESELILLHNNFASLIEVFCDPSSQNTAVDAAIVRRLSELSMFLAHVTPFYPGRLASFPGVLIDLFDKVGRSLPPPLRSHLAQALIFLVNRKIVNIEETLGLFMHLQTLGDKNLRKLTFAHVVHTIRRMNQKHKNEAKNRKLQNLLFSMLQEDDELNAKRSLAVLCDLHRRKVWFDDRTADAICNACSHSSSKVMVTALSYLLGYDKVEEDDNDGSSSEDDMSAQKREVILSREDIYKACHKGTAATKKKKKAKLQRVIRSMKRQQRRSSENVSSLYTPLTHLKDPQAFAEKLFSRLQKCNEQFKVRVMILKVVARTIGLHRLVLLNFYPFLQKYVQPHQRDVTNLLAAGVQACHDMVPPCEVEPLLRQVVNQFVHNRSRPEAIAVGLNVAREICLRMPLLMTEDLLQDLVLYKKSHEKAVSTAARSLITLFREICPSMLVKKDRGRPSNPKARPKAFGEVSFVSGVPGIEFLEADSDSSLSGEDDEANISKADSETLGPDSCEICEGEEDLDEAQTENRVFKEENSEEEAVDVSCGKGENSVDNLKDSDDDSEDHDVGDDDYDDEGDEDDHLNDSEDSVSCNNDCGDEDDHDGKDEDAVEDNNNGKKRKLSDYMEKLNAADKSLRALKKIAGMRMVCASPHTNDGILSNEDFQQIKELKAKKEAKLALSRQGLLKNSSDLKSSTFIVPSSDQLGLKCLDPAKLEINVKRRLSKEQRLALVREGREERGKYQARTAVKQKKTGGLSNRQKERKKAMPFAARKAKAARSRQERRKQHRSGKQFRGRKAWK